MNYFEPKAAAERYAQGRPDVHKHSIDRIRDFLSDHSRHLSRHLSRDLYAIDQKLDRALDIACGTGLSTRALTALAHEVHGTDLSPEMLAHAEKAGANGKGGRIHYRLAPAEKQPFDQNIFDLITVSSGVHWFDIAAFLKEAHRVLKSKGLLVLYENYFDPGLDELESFKTWCMDVYFSQFPSPPRNNKYDWSNENLRPFGLEFLVEKRSTYTVPMTREQLALYFTTQSNVIARVESGEKTFAGVEAWLLNELQPFFEAGRADRAIRFGNWIKFIRRID